jgi:hypothetical protein
MRAVEETEMRATNFRNNSLSKNGTRLTLSPKRQPEVQRKPGKPSGRSFLPVTHGIVTSLGSRDTSSTQIELASATEP